MKLQNRLTGRNRTKRLIPIDDTDQSDVTICGILEGDIEDDDRDPLEDLEFVRYARSFS